MSSPLSRAKARMIEGDLFHKNQLMGRLQSIGCVAVEITQKCNLDCTLCYLSEHSQAVKDIPIEEVFRRLDQVVEHYGKGTHVQITGGDPTLRKHTELIRIVAHARSIGLYPALFTNGIAASRKLLSQLADAGLSDVAFHVDTTQQREGYDTEAQLNEIREDYIRRAKGLGLMVIFNTTVHKGNFHEIPALVAYMKSHAKNVSFASFQLQAETGRGEWRERDIVVSRESVQKQIELGLNRPLPWDLIQLGHPHCHSYMPTLIVGKKAIPVVSNKQFFEGLMSYYGDLKWDRHKGPARLFWQFFKATISRPATWKLLAKGAGEYIHQFAFEILKNGGKAHKMSFFIQNFMDAKALEPDRVHACSFMVMTADGPISMCEHNSKRDEYILKPLEVSTKNGDVIHYKPLEEKSNKNTKPENRIATVEILN